MSLVLGGGPDIGWDALVGNLFITSDSCSHNAIKQQPGWRAYPGHYTPEKGYRNADRVPKKVEGDIDWGKVVSV